MVDNDNTQPVDLSYSFWSTRLGIYVILMSFIDRMHCYICVDRPIHVNLRVMSVFFVRFNMRN